MNGHGVLCPFLRSAHQVLFLVPSLYRLLFVLWRYFERLGIRFLRKRSGWSGRFKRKTIRWNEWTAGFGLRRQRQLGGDEGLKECRKKSESDYCRVRVREYEALTLEALCPAFGLTRRAAVRVRGGRAQGYAARMPPRWLLGPDLRDRY